MHIHVHIHVLVGSKSKDAFIDHISATLEL